MISKLINSVFINTYFCLDPASITLHRYDDPILGPRTKPVAADVLKEKTKIPSDSIFSVNTETKNVEINVAGNTYTIGEFLIYFDVSREKNIKDHDI